MPYDDFHYAGALAGAIEERWQRHWREHRVFHAEPATERPKRYVLDMFAGPSGALHVGHPLGYVATDAYGRYSRMRGYNVLHAFGFDAFGLPAEQHAVRTGAHPRVTTEQNIATIRRQLDGLGMAHDPRRGVGTTDVGFYRWTQWIFSRIFQAWYDDRVDRARPIADLVAEFETGARPTPDGRPWTDLDERERRHAVDAHRLAYVSEEEVNWCPGLGTVLASEEVTDQGRSERGDFPVFRRKLGQWMLRITAYADRLDRDLSLVDWPEAIKTQQRRWIPGMRDWLFSRQRYWGEPFPIVYDEHGPIALPDELLPVELPETADYTPRTFDPFDADSDPEAPLARLRDWTNVTLDLGDGRGPREYRRETNTMPQWAGSCWYELRYLDPANSEAFCDPALERYWMGPRDERDGGGVDLYVGGPEHAVLHLLYARFWHKVLYDLGHVSSREPFRRLVNNGYIQAHAYRDDRGIVVPADEVVERDGGWFHEGRPVTRSLGKMGKSLGNMVTPDEIRDRYGADTFRVHILSIGPLRESRPWDPDGVVGAHRFLQRVWRAIVDERTGVVTVVDDPAAETTRRLLHQTIDAVGRDLEDLAFNTAITRMIELTNHVTGLRRTPREVAEALVLMLAPVAPHLAEELWSRLGYAESLAYTPFPTADPAYLVADTVVCVIQVDGRLRERTDVSSDATEDTLRELALSADRVRAGIAGRAVRRVVVRLPTAGARRGALVNVVTG